MTIDEAIKIVDAITENAVEIWELNTTEFREFRAMCADALRLMKRTIDKPKGENAAPETWQERMKREYRETKERYEKLHRLVTKYEAGVLEFTPKSSIELLRQQKRHMGEYLHDLEIRAEIEGVNLYD